MAVNDTGRGTGAGVDAQSTDGEAPSVSETPDGPYVLSLKSSSRPAPLPGTLLIVWSGAVTSPLPRSSLHDRRCRWPQRHRPCFPD
jgi:hypothetical protein